MKSCSEAGTGFPLCRFLPSRSSLARPAGRSGGWHRPPPRGGTLHIPLAVCNTAEERSRMHRPMSPPAMPSAPLLSSFPRSNRNVPSTPWWSRSSTSSRPAGLATGPDSLPGERHLQRNRDGCQPQHGPRRNRDLQDAGVLAVEAGGSGGTHVASISMQNLSWPTASHGRQRLFESLEARRVVEPRIAQLAALRGTTDDFDAIRRTIDLQRAEQSDWWRITQGNSSSSIASCGARRATGEAGVGDALDLSQALRSTLPGALP